MLKNLGELWRIKLRKKLEKIKRTNEKENDRIREQIAELLSKDASEVQGIEIEKYKL